MNIAQGLYFRKFEVAAVLFFALCVFFGYTEGARSTALDGWMDRVFFDGLANATSDGWLPYYMVVFMAGSACQVMFLAVAGFGAAAVSLILLFAPPVLMMLVFKK